MPNKIASKSEWALAKSILETERKKGALYSGFKIDLKKHKQLKHSFVYLSDDDGNETLVALSRYYLLGRGVVGKAKLVEEENGDLHALKIIKKNKYSKISNEKLILERLGTLRFHGAYAKGEYFLQEFYAGLTLDKYCDICVLSDEQKGAIAYYLVKALKHLHEKYVIHNDFLSENCIINVTPEKTSVHPIDFDKSKMFSNQEETEQFIYRDIQDLGLTFRVVLKWEKYLISGMTIDQLLEKFEKYSSVVLPVPDVRTRLLEDYKYMLDWEQSKIRNDINLANDWLSYFVRKTNDISQLNELFKFVKETEKANPLLRKKSNVVGMTDAWKSTINIFKTRAIQIAHDNKNLEIPITKPEQYYNILAENNLGRWTASSSRLYKFEKLLKDKSLAAFDVEAYERDKLIKYFESYTDRIEEHKDFSYGFWFDKKNRGINRKANYEFACVIKKELRDPNRTLAQIFDDENLKQLRNQFVHSRGIYSFELLRAIRRGKALAKKITTSQKISVYNRGDRI